MTIKEDIAKKLKVPPKHISITLDDNLISIGKWHKSYEYGYNDTMNDYGRYDRIASVSISPFPGCCGISVINGLSVAENYQNKGLGEIIIRLALHKIYLRGKGLAIATEIVTNKNAIAIAASVGAFQLSIDDKASSFINPNTGNKICILACKPVKLTKAIG